MSADFDRLRNELLDLGLEDWIPVPEAVGSPEILEAIGDEDVVSTLRRALSELVREGRLRLYRGRRDLEALPVTTQAGIALLEDPSWYSFHLDDPLAERLFFVNVDNIRDE